MFNQIIAIIVSFFVSLFGSSSAPDEAPDTLVNPDAQQGMQEEEITVGDEVSVFTHGNIEASARITQTNGNKFTVELTVTGRPNATIFVAVGDVIYNLTTSADGILSTSFLTDSLDISVSTL